MRIRIVAQVIWLGIGLMLWPVFSSAEILEYVEKLKNKTITHYNHIQAKPEGYVVEVDMVVAQKNEAHVLVDADTDFSTLRWINQNLEKKLDIIGVREGNRIVLTGVNQGQGYTKVHNIDERPWKQLFPLDLALFVISPAKSMEFWAIHTTNPDMIGAFYAEKKETAFLPLAGQQEEVVLVRITLAGWLAFLWHGDYWCRKSDGRCLRLESADGPSLIELVQETKE